MTKIAVLALVAVAAAPLAGCGNSAPAKPTVQAPPVEKGVFISASDCADSGKLSADVCGQIIDQAVAAHEKNAPTYKFLRLCTTAVGPERCAKGVDGQYRARLQAFLVIMAQTPAAVPLYPAGSGVVGFVAANKDKIDARDETLIVSNDALALANENAKLSASN